MQLKAFFYILEVDALVEKGLSMTVVYDYVTGHSTHTGKDTPHVLA